ncbi:MAG: RNA polymerase factor sigma-54 [Gammaproteobacteria bacterium]|nr:RNA polymerase factor sigma-54 [Gammaproteobacteria bacterium]
MKQSLQMKMGQQLAMTPQLQQAIKLLQLSTLELQTEIQTALENNPMLEMQEEETPDGNATVNEDDKAAEAKEAKRQEDDAKTEKEKAEEKAAAEAELDMTTAPVESDFDMTSATMEFTQEDSEVLPEDLPVDSAWEDIYDTGTPATPSGSSDGEHRDFTEFHNAGISSIQDHLNEQINLTPLSDKDQFIATALIDAIDDNGYLIEDIDVLIDGLNRDINDPEARIELDEVETVLHMVQHLDPPGCGARDAGECMFIQLCQLPENEIVEQAKRLVTQHLELLAAHDFPKLRRLLKINDERLRDIIALIRSLNPRPGRQIVQDHDQYIVPDVFVQKVKGVWRVELNPDIAPKLGINALYAGMVKRADKSDDNNFLRNHLQEARWFIKSLQSRNETLLRVGTAIVERQRSFLEYGEEAMKPLVLRDIAEQLSLHESTISRVTTQKYIHTPRGIFEFKYFFSSHVSTANGGECSATAIRAMIKKYIAAEDAGKPLSDSKIASTLVSEGIQVARRTVAKYRESMAIPPSNERKRLG